MLTLNRLHLARALASLLIASSPIFAFAFVDSVARIKVSVGDEFGRPYQECRMDLLDVDDRRILDARIMIPDGIVSFILPPGSNPYLLRINCKGSNETFTAGPVMLGDFETSYKVPVDLGTVQLKREKSQQ